MPIGHSPAASSGRWEPQQHRPAIRELGRLPFETRVYYRGRGTLRAGTISVQPIAPASQPASHYHDWPLAFLWVGGTFLVGWLFVQVMRLSRESGRWTRRIPSIRPAPSSAVLLRSGLRRLGVRVLGSASWTKTAIGLRPRKQSVAMNATPHGRGGPAHLLSGVANVHPRAEVLARACGRHGSIDDAPRPKMTKTLGHTAK